ncbi:exported hypothetical protein [Syntrophobacter sp. SbD1]|nr:exported hypothetical protein [Syntrophobacter sp. SbD1]
MKIKTAWAIQSFFLCLLFNLAFSAVIFFMADRIMEALNEWVSPLSGPGGPALPEDLKMALASFDTFVVQVRGYMITVLVPLASAFTLLMWFFLFLAGRRQIRRAGEQAELSSKATRVVAQEATGDSLPEMIDR